MFEVLVTEGVFLKNKYYRVSILLTTGVRKMNEINMIRTRFETEMLDMVGEPMTFTEVDNFNPEMSDGAKWFRIGGTYYFAQKENAVHANFILGIIKNELI